MIKIFKNTFVLILVVFNVLILRGQVKLGVVKAGATFGAYEDKDSITSTNGWGVYVTYEHFWAKHFSTSLNISTFKTTFTKYNIKKRMFEPLGDLMGNLVLSLKHYPLRIDNSPYLGVGIGAHICDCYGFSKKGLGKIRESIGGFDAHFKVGYQIILNEKIAINVMGDYAFVRPGRENFLKQYQGVIQFGYVLD
jgi:hypothetical protein